MAKPPRDIVDRVTIVEITTDTCDACPAAAQVRAYVYVDLNPGTLAFCGHHGTRFIPTLLEAGATIIDHRHLIGP